MELNDKQKQKLLAMAEIADKGELAIVSKMFEMEDSFDSTLEQAQGVVDDVTSSLEEVKGLVEDVRVLKSEVKQGDKGDTGADGKDGVPGKPGRDGRDGRDGLDGRDGVDGKDGRDGTDGKDGKDAQIDEQWLKDIERMVQANANSLPTTTTNFYKAGALVGRAKNIDVRSGTTYNVQIIGDTAIITVPTGGGGGGQVNSIVAGANISVDATDPANPIVSATAGSGSFLTPTGTVNGTNKIFTVLSAPTMVIADGMGRVAGFGYTYSAPNITFDIAPQDWVRYM